MPAEAGERRSRMSKDEKIIRAKVGLFELAKHRGRPGCERFVSPRRFAA